MIRVIGWKTESFTNKWVRKTDSSRNNDSTHLNNATCTGNPTYRSTQFRKSFVDRRKSTWSVHEGWQSNRVFLSWKPVSLGAWKLAWDAICKLHFHKPPILDIFGCCSGCFYCCSSVPNSIGHKMAQRCKNSSTKIDLSAERELLAEMVYFGQSPSFGRNLWPK